MFLEKSTQNIVQQLSGVYCLEVERRFAARLDPQHAIAEKAKSAIAKGAQAAGAVDMLGAEMPAEHRAQISVSDFTVVGSKPIAVALALNTHATHRGRRKIAGLF